MGLFHFGKKKNEKESCCSGNINASAVSKANESRENGASVKVLGSGCSKCMELEQNVRLALDELGMDTTIDHITDFGEIAAYGVMSTPALVVDGKVVAFGKVLKKEEAVKLLKKIRC